MVCMTEKQRGFIKDICDVLKIDFDDCKNFSKMEASKFISDNIKEYKLARCKAVNYNCWECIYHRVEILPEYSHLVATCCKLEE